MNSIEALNFSKMGHHTLKMIQDLDRPVIAAVNGFALGGGTEIALACDFIYASENARFGLPEVTLGIFPGFGGTQRLPRLIGKGKAKELILTGKMISCPGSLSDGDCQQGFSPGLSDGGDQKGGRPNRSERGRWREVGQDGDGWWLQYGSLRSLLFRILCLRHWFHYRGPERGDDGFHREEKTQF